MNQDPTRPVIICEYAHAMGNGLGNFKKYWDAFDTYPRLQGGFIWDWVDQALRHPGPGGRAVWNWVNTSDGANGNDGLVNADRTPQPEIQEAKKVQQPVKVEAVDARPAACACATPTTSSTSPTSRSSGGCSRTASPCSRATLAEPLDLRPGESRELTLPVDAAKLGPDQRGHPRAELQAARGAALGPARARGGVGADARCRGRGRRRRRHHHWRAPTPPARRSGATARGVVLASPDFAATIEDGGLVSYRWKGEEQLAGPLVPHLWRVPTDNDEGGGRASFAHRWREAGLDRLQVVAQEPRSSRLSADQVRVMVESRLAGRRRRPCA